MTPPLDLAALEALCKRWCDGEHVASREIADAFVNALPRLLAELRRLRDEVAGARAAARAEDARVCADAAVGYEHAAHNCVRTDPRDPGPGDLMNRAYAARALAATVAELAAREPSPAWLEAREREAERRGIERAAQLCLDQARRSRQLAAARRAEHNERGSSYHEACADGAVSAWAAVRALAPAEGAGEVSR
jgi:hypothetical protein